MTTLADIENAVMAEKNAEIERLRMELRDREIMVEDRGASFGRVTAELAAMTAARDDACAMLEATFTELSALVARVANSPLRAAVADDDWRAVMASHDEGIALATAQIAALRAVGKVVTP